MNNRDDIPLRTIKTLIYLIVRQKGDAILSHFTLIENKDESELSYYVQKSLRQCEKNNQQQPQKNKQNVSSISTNSDVTTLMNNNGRDQVFFSPCINNSSFSTSQGNKKLDGGNDENSSNMIITFNNNHGGKFNDDTSTKIVVPTSNGLESNLPPRVFNRDFPLQTRQLNCTNNASAAAKIPVICSEDDLRLYCEYTARQLNMPELNYDEIRARALDSNSIKSVSDAEHAVEAARDRLEKIKLLFNGHSNSASAITTTASTISGGQ